LEEWQEGILILLILSLKSNDCVDNRKDAKSLRKRYFSAPLRLCGKNKKKL
jgi:hypothetical protein